MPVLRRSQVRQGASRWPIETPAPIFPRVSRAFIQKTQPAGTAPVLDRAFSTVAADHANCSVGSYTHGFLTLDEAAKTDDLAAVLEAGWVDARAVEALPHVGTRPERIVYGPLSTLPVDPEVVLIRIIGAALMTLRNALPGLRIEGKPQCHIIAIAAEVGEPAASVGCALSRARTGMPVEEMTCALPAEGLVDAVAKIEAAAELDRAMDRYARADARRFVSASDPN